MSDKKPPEGKGEAAATAFAHVLDAERAAEAAVELCRKEADRRLAEACATERCLAERVEARVLLWRARLKEAAAGQVAELDRQATQLTAPLVPDAAAQERAARAAARVADQLLAGD
jgi:hypothetical protein